MTENPTPERPDTRGLTPNGWPYVTPDDHPKEYPAVSQQLAEKLETATSNPSPLSLALIPAHRGSRLLLAAVISDAAGNADFQFGAALSFSQAPIISAIPIYGGPATCVISEVTTTRVYVTVRNAAGAPLSGVFVHFIAIGFPAPGTTRPAPDEEPLP